jgi:protein SCO1
VKRLWIFVLIFFVPFDGWGTQSANPLREVGLEQRLNEQVPLDLKFYDEAGVLCSMKELAQEKPVILSLVYYQCPMLCSVTLDGLSKSLQKVNLTAGNEFEVLLVSIHPLEKPEQAISRKKAIVQNSSYGLENRWKFLTGTEDQIRLLAESVGFQYRYEPEIKEYAHAAGIIVLTPSGKISRYFYGSDYPSRDLRLSLVEASQNKIGSATDRLLLLCYKYDPTTGQYGLSIMRVIRLGGIMTVVTLGACIVMLGGRHRRSKEMPE